MAITWFMRQVEAMVDLRNEWKVIPEEADDYLPIIYSLLERSKHKDVV